MARKKAATRRIGPGAGRVAPHSSRLRTAFAKVVDVLEELGTRYAVVGGIAIGARVDPRTTKDIDFAIQVDDDAQADALIFALRQRGYSIAAVFQRKDGRLATARTFDASRVLIDYLFNTARIEREVVDAATRMDVAGIQVPVAQSRHLLAMKIKANRPQDAIDIVNLVSHATPKELRHVESLLKLMQARGADPHRDFVAELREHVARSRRTDDDLILVRGRRRQRPT